MAVAASAILLCSCTQTPGPPANGGLDKDGLPLGPVTEKFVQARFEGHLVYPGAKLFKSIGGDEQKYSEGTNSAFTGGLYTTGDPRTRVYAWYDAQLLPRGWTHFQVPIAGPQVLPVGYQRGDRENFLIAVDKPDLLKDIIGGVVPTDQMIFEERYTIGAASHGN